MSDDIKKLVEAQWRQIEVLTELNATYEAEIRAHRGRAAWQEAARADRDGTMAMLESDDCPPLPPGWEFAGLSPVRTADRLAREESSPEEPTHILAEAAKARGLS